MAPKKPAVDCSSLKVLHSLFYVSDENVIEIPATKITPELVGEKAFGLSCLPTLWTLPFVVLSDKLLALYVSAPPINRTKVLEWWGRQIVNASLAVGMNLQDQIIVRSSGCTEGLEDRGKFYSVQGPLRNIIIPLAECLEKLASDKELHQQKVPLVVQKCVIPISAKGHLSNERRVYEEKRDWLGQYEGVEGQPVRSFQVNIRNWRSKVVVNRAIETALNCNLSAHVAELLKIPAAWAYEQKLRLHFEWVWDGKTIYLVQADREHELHGVDPTKILQNRRNTSPEFTPKCLQAITAAHASKFEKIRNVLTYFELGLPIIKLYVLDSQSIIADLASGNVAHDLEEDLLELVKGSLVIRMDVDTSNQELRQLLPRTNEVREFADAVNWLKTQSAMVKNSEIKNDIVFIFHNFVPAVSSAFAYATPTERKVQIEALWGLPEGLYYNAHDKYIVDTKKSRVENLFDKDKKDFTVQEKRAWKRFFVTPDSSGHWVTEVLSRPYDWRSVIQQEDWLKEIAFESRRIAAKEGKSLSIMWFVGVDSAVCDRPVFPWFHEVYDPGITSRAQTHRTKTPFDKSLKIETSADIEQLQLEALAARSSVRRVKIQPREEKLLRDKNTLRKIGELALKIDAIILLEGGVLSHAYYQLMQTKAIVEVVHPFADFDDKRDFNKLVRDKIPSNIESEGEIVSKTILSGEFLLRALREKLIEESFEVLDAVDQDSILGELADVNEVIDGILSQLGLGRDSLQAKQEKKCKKAGGFKNGIVLLETKNPLPTQKKRLSGVTLFGSVDEGSVNTAPLPPIDPREVIELGHSIDKKWHDKREHPAATETLLSLRVPMVRDSWTALTQPTDIDSSQGSIVQAKITGKREGAKVHIELSLFLSQKQLKLF